MTSTDVKGISLFRAKTPRLLEISTFSAFVPCCNLLCLDSSNWILKHFHYCRWLIHLFIRAPTISESIGITFSLAFWIFLFVFPFSPFNFTWALSFFEWLFAQRGALFIPHGSCLDDDSRTRFVSLICCRTFHSCEWAHSCCYAVYVIHCIIYTLGSC